MKSVELKNDKVVVGVCKETGSILQITSVESGKRFLSEPSGARLFRMMLPLKDWPTHYADSHINNTPEIMQRENGLEILFDDLNDIRGISTGIRVVVKVALPAKSAEALFSMEVENKGKHVIEQVRFPWVGGLTSIAGSGQDKLAIASKLLDLSKILPQENPHTFARFREKLFFDYPFPLLLPYLDISGENQGVGYICYLKKPHTGGLGIERLNPFDENPSLSVAWAANPFIQPGCAWCSPDVGISVHAGDWHRTADRFRNWTDSWWVNPRPPAKLKRSLGIGNVQFTEFSGETIHTFAQLPALADEFAAAGIHDLCLWHKAGGLYCMNGSSKEIMDEPEAVLKELKAALVKVKRAGVNMSIILNLRLLKVIFEPFREIGESEAMRPKDGSHDMRESYSCSPYHLDNMGPCYNIGDSVTLCQRPNSPFAERARKIIEKMLALGFTSIFTDQPINQGCCFAPHHKHSSPDIVHDECVQWMAEVGKQVKSRSEDGYMIGELPELFQTQKIDLWWHWQWKYLAPEVYRYSHPDSLQLWVIDGDVGELNRAFAMGFYISLTPAGMERGLSARPAVAAQCAALSRLRRETAGWTVDTRFVDREGLSVEGAPSVVAYAFAGNQKAAVIAAEISGVASDVTLAFSPAEHGLASDRPGIVHRLSGGEEQTSLPANGTHTLKTTLNPYEVIVWIFG